MWSFGKPDPMAGNILSPQRRSHHFVSSDLFSPYCSQIYAADLKNRTGEHGVGAKSHEQCPVDLMDCGCRGVETLAGP